MIFYYLFLYHRILTRFSRSKFYGAVQISTEKNKDSMISVSILYVEK